MQEINDVCILLSDTQVHACVRSHQQAHQRGAEARRKTQRIRREHADRELAISADLSQNQLKLIIKIQAFTRKRLEQIRLRAKLRRVQNNPRDPSASRWPRAHVFAPACLGMGGAMMLMSFGCIAMSCVFGASGRKHKPYAHTRTRMHHTNGRNQSAQIHSSNQGSFAKPG